MKIAIFGKKYENTLNEFREEVRVALKKYKVKEIDESYFNTTRDEDASKPKETFKAIESILFKSDAVIIESTQHSDGMGIVIGLALGLNKPVLVLYNEQDRKNVFSSIAIATATTNRVTVAGYTMNKIEELVKEFLSKAENQIFTKFYINLSPEINRYLEWWSVKNRRAKVERIRELLSQDISQNVKWQELQTEE